MEHSNRIGRWIALLITLVMTAAACGTAATDTTRVADQAPVTTVQATTTTPDSAPVTIVTTVVAEGPFAVVEAANGSVEIPSRPRTIVSLSPTATEMLFAIGAGDQVAAVDEFSYYPEDAPVTDLSGFTPNLEAIGEYAPDLVVVANDLDGIVDALTSANIPVLLLPAAVEFADVYEQLRALGAATGNTEAAETVSTGLEIEIQAAVDAAGERAEGLRVYHELDPTLYSITSETFVGLVYEAFGFENVADAADVDGFGYPQLSAEYVIEADPDLIFITNCCGDTPETVAERPGWDNIAAIESGAVIVVDTDVSSRWGPRLIDFFRIVSDAIIGLSQ